MNLSTLSIGRIMRPKFHVRSTWNAAEAASAIPMTTLAETINGLYKAEVIHRRGPWRRAEAVEFATLEWVDCSITASSSRSAISLPPRPRRGTMSN